MGRRPASGALGKPTPHYKSPPAVLTHQPAGCKNGAGSNLASMKLGWSSTPAMFWLQKGKLEENLELAGKLSTKLLTGEETGGETPAVCVTLILSFSSFYLSTLFYPRLIELLTHMVICRSDLFSVYGLHCNPILTGLVHTISFSIFNFPLQWKCASIRKN